ncbi:hypothetical protein [Nocardia nepalensis]|uniref:hypothetical protein n=1 Tax=Nocardia nepalensis TaxID=3375448 RepID=UPI003B67475C
MSDRVARRARWVRFAPAGYSGVLSLLIGGPLLGPGYLLLRDAVSTPRSYMTDSALGLGDAAPRAVPQDALVAALSSVIDGGLIVKAILVVALWAAGYGAAVLARELLRVSTGPQLVAVTVALWNPYVAERLLQGHWSLLTGYAALPWIALAAYRIRTGTTDAACNLALDDPSAERRRIAPTAADRPNTTDLATAGPRNRNPAPTATTVSRRARFRRTKTTDLTTTTPDKQTPTPATAIVSRRARFRRTKTTDLTTTTPDKQTPTPAAPIVSRRARFRRTKTTDLTTTTPDKRTPAPTTTTVSRRARFWRAKTLDMRTPRRAASWAALAGCFAAAGLTPTGALLAGCTAIVLIGRRNLLGTLALLLAASAPWLTATALSGAGSEPSDPAGIAAFAARAEPALGTLGSLAGLGGIWNADSVPDSRTTPLALIGTALLLILVATGIRATATMRSTPRGVPSRSTTRTSHAPDIAPGTTPHLTPAAPETIGTAGKATTSTTTGTRAEPKARTGDAANIETGTSTAAARNATHVESGSATAHSTHHDAETANSNATQDTDRASIRIRRALLILAAAAVALPALGATSWGMSVLEWLVAHVPGAGLLRDTQKYVALAMPAYALCAAAGCRTVATWFTTNAAAAEYGEPQPDTRTTTADANQKPSVRTSTDDTDHHPNPHTTTDDTDHPNLRTTTHDTDHHPNPRTTANESDQQPNSHAEVWPRSAASTFAVAKSTTAAEEDRCTAPETAAARTSTELSTHNSRTTVMALIAAVFIALLTLPLFDLAWGVGNELRPVHYPIGWQRVAERIDGPGDIAVLPGGMFRKFPYSGRAPVLDPAPRMLPRDVLQTGELPVHGRTVAGEGARAREVESVLLHGGSVQQLAGLGVGWVLLERTTPGPLGESKTTLAQLESVYSDAQLALYRVPGTTDHRAESHLTHRVIAYAAHILWAALLVGGLLLAAVLRPREKNAPDCDTPLRLGERTQGR